MHNTPEEYKKLVRPTVSLTKVGKYPDAEILYSYNELNAYIAENGYIENAVDFESFLELNYEKGPIVFLKLQNKYVPYFKPKVYTKFIFKNSLNYMNLGLLTEEEVKKLKVPLHATQRYIVRDYSALNIMYQIDNELLLDKSPSIDDQDYQIVTQEILDKKNDMYFTEYQVNHLKDLFGEHFNDFVAEEKPVLLKMNLEKVDNTRYLKIRTNSNIKLDNTVIFEESWIPFFHLFQLPKTIVLNPNILLDFAFYGSRIFVKVDAEKFEELNSHFNIQIVRDPFDSVIRADSNFKDMFAVGKAIEHKTLLPNKYAKSLKISFVKLLCSCMVKSGYYKGPLLYRYEKARDTPYIFPRKYVPLDYFQTVFVEKFLYDEDYKTDEDNVFLIKNSRLKDFHDDYKSLFHQIEILGFNTHYTVIRTHSNELEDDALNIMVTYT